MKTLVRLGDVDYWPKVCRIVHHGPKLADPSLSFTSRSLTSHAKTVKQSARESTTTLTLLKALTSEPSDGVTDAARTHQRYKPRVTYDLTHQTSDHFPWSTCNQYAGISTDVAAPQENKPHMAWSLASVIPRTGLESDFLFLFIFVLLQWVPSAVVSPVSGTLLTRLAG